MEFVYHGPDGSELRKTLQVKLGESKAATKIAANAVAGTYAAGPTPPFTTGKITSISFEGGTWLIWFNGIEIDCYLHPQSPDIAGAVEVPADSPEDDEAIGAGDQGVVIGYACNETPELMPMPVVIAHRLTSLLTLARMTDAVHGIGPDGKAMVVVEYEDDKPVRVAQILLSVQHEAGVHIEEIQADIFAQIILPALKGMPADDQMEVILNPSGSFVVGGPEADTGLTGRKLMVDTYNCLLYYNCMIGHRSCCLFGFGRVCPSNGSTARPGSGIKPPKRFGT